MPPWKPVEGYGRFAGTRRLTQSEIQTIVNWARNGARIDDAASPSAPPVATGWKLGEPDRVIEMPAPFTVAAHSDDQYRCFVVPLNLSKDQYIRAVEFRPSNRSVVHHVLLFGDSSHAARELAEKNGGSYSCFGTPGFLPSAAFGGWSPGASAIQLPDDAAMKVRAGSDLVIQTHFHSRGKDEQEQSKIGFYFTDRAPTRAVMDVGLTSRAIDIPAGDAAYHVRDHFEIPIDVHAIGIIPHAHYVCRDMKGWAILPGGRKVWLLWINDWDFNWQDQYHYVQPVKLPAGTRVEMDFTYDNSAGNRQNPNSPPQRVVWGPQSTDEMAGLHIQVIPDRMAEAPDLAQALWGKIMRMVGGKFYQPPTPK